VLLSLFYVVLLIDTFLPDRFLFRYVMCCAYRHVYFVINVVKALEWRALCHVPLEYVYLLHLFM
jgi:hypothetical protein